MKTFAGFYKGINLGGWLSQGWHNKQHYDSFITEADIKKISSWGLDHVRLPVDYEAIENESGQYKEEGFKYIDNCFAWCQKYRLNLIIDLHKTAGYMFTDILENGNKAANTFFSNELLKERFINLWVEISKRYGKYPDMIAFELLNEMVEANNGKSWNALCEKAIGTIRIYAPDTKIILGGPNWNDAYSLRLLDSPCDENIIYNFHFYEPKLFTHQKAHWVKQMPKDITTYYPDAAEVYKKHSERLGDEGAEMLKETLQEIGQEFIEKHIKEAASIAEERGVALYCGEYGVIDQAPLDSTLNWYCDMHALFEKYHIGRAAWTYKEKDFGITDKHYAPIVDKIIELL
ncbi:cellulase (glycosyl hydrolase family 5) [Anaerobacterium chartisolvens]|uniref:Cellulase (Glycosyl hydrolase family 5) n=1 Tax=Anaerobacterium chartisolvens TaxID=1297424 RepID=A0A369BHZ6_9FIRM|nr:cellulase family glycosylhydrolase [Anaerobacterium chartisolvens]RCX20077.1 cellulase (glycosyl hydrolase family 5) [Anaerobacterium chartisolvens]